MARTASQVLASARTTMNDAAKRRLPDTEGLTYVVDALNTVKNARPDLFIGNWGAIETIGLNDNLPLDSQFFRPVVDFVIARAETKDVEAVQNARAKLLADLGGGFLT
jgi:hypothetical protein